MEKFLEEIQFQVPFKDTTETGDIVLMLREEESGRPSANYARVIGFERDASKRDEWWHVRFVFLSVPPMPHTIILQAPHFTGQEVFTMGGRKVFIKAVNFEAFKENEHGGGKAGRDDKAPAEPEDKERGGGKPTFTLVK